MAVWQSNAKDDYTIVDLIFSLLNKLFRYKGLYFAAVREDVVKMCVESHNTASE